MKSFGKYIALAGLAAAVAASAVAGNWNHVLMGRGSYSGSATIPTYAHVEQYASTSYDLIVSSGPAGYYSLSPGQSLDAETDVGPGTYSIYQYVGPNSGYVVTYFTW